MKTIVAERNLWNWSCASFVFSIQKQSLWILTNCWASCVCAKKQETEILVLVNKRWQKPNDLQSEYSDDWLLREFLNTFQWVLNDCWLWQQCLFLIWFSDFFLQKQDEKESNQRNCNNDWWKKWQDESCLSSLHYDWNELECLELKHLSLQSFEWLCSVNYIQSSDTSIQSITKKNCQKLTHSRCCWTVLWKLSKIW